MSPVPASVKLPRALSGLWLLTASLSALAVPVLMVTVPYWHDVRHYLQQLGFWQAWVSIAVCVGLLVISRRKHAETEEAWAQGALLIFVMGGMLTGILLNYGVLPQWLVQPASLAKTAQVLVLMVLHWGCALQAWRCLRRFAQPVGSSVGPE